MYSFAQVINGNQAREVAGVVARDLLVVVMAHLHLPRAPGGFSRDRGRILMYSFERSTVLLARAPFEPKHVPRIIDEGHSADRAEHPQPSPLAALPRACPVHWAFVHRTCCQSLSKE